MAQSGLMFDDFSRCESPIEALLQLAMAASSKRGLLEWCDADNLDDLLTCVSEVEWPCILVAGQVRVDAAGARPDFIMAQRREGTQNDFAMLAVECDGEKFHHGNADAVVRDRNRDEKLSALGIVPIHLRGTWIALDPLKSLHACLVKLRDSQPPFYMPRPLIGTHRRLAAQWSKRQADLSLAARTLSFQSDLTSVVGSSMLAKREKLRAEVLGR
jgi:hypothetical protein